MHEMLPNVVNNSGVGHTGDCLGSVCMMVSQYGFYYFTVAGHLYFVLVSAVVTDVSCVIFCIMW